ncbi:uncharacterized protein FTJAE_2700 [Fusarium tjaetaba]|uniref:Uncharacterized protein n=1 Tax=Fusarium tjaetaba TaxID=1567544 RepID=A0A8H5S5V3_9HYPO|nr:uncharacterized protein FTJAE_2700 [Fusarium tjaetaba]KAF5644737.1 hypothetical protein FTJAE_2700 [Fusarium tjaetaba]
MKYYQPVDPEDQESEADNIFEKYLERFCLNMEYHKDNFKDDCRKVRDGLRKKLRCKLEQLKKLKKLPESMRHRIKRRR